MHADTQGNDPRYHEAYTVFERYLQSAIAKDVDTWMSVWDEACVLEFPFAPQGRTARIEGKADLRPYIQDVFNRSDFTGAPVQQVIHQTLDPDLIIAEITMEGRMIATGRAYIGRYVWVMQTFQGKLIHMRDYWNPLATLEASKELEGTQ